MATIHSAGTGNWTSSSTWALVDATSFLDSRANVSFATGGTTQSFTPGAITVAGISLQLRGRSTSPSGTFNVALYTGAAVVAGATVTINVSDLPDTNGDQSGFLQNSWTYFKFASPVTLLAATSYYIRATGGAIQVAVQRNATVNNWSRALVTTTNQSPASTDTIIVAGEYTGAGTNSSVTVTMDNTAAGATYGTIYLANKGVLTYGTASSTFYRLVQGRDSSFLVGTAGEFYIGSSGYPMPVGSTALHEIGPTAANISGLVVEGKYEAYGATMSYTMAKLATNEAAGSTTSLFEVSTGWRVGDTILFPSTAYNIPGAVDTETIDSVTGPTVTHTALAHAHGGSASEYVQATVGNLTRNVLILGTNVATAPLGIVRGLNASLKLSYVEMRNFGGTTTTSPALLLGTSAGFQSPGMVVDIKGCSIHRTAATTGTLGIYHFADPGVTGSTATVTITDSIIYNYGAQALTTSNSNTLSVFTINNNLFCRNAAGTLVSIYPVDSFDGNVVANSASTGVVLTKNNTVGTFDNNSIYSNGGVGLSFTSTPTTGLTYSVNHTLNGNMIWRNGVNNVGLVISSSGTAAFTLFPDQSVIFNDLNLHGNQYQLAINGVAGNLRFNNCSMWAGTAGLSGGVGTYGIVQPQVSGGIPGSSKIDFNGGLFGKTPSGVTSSFSISNIVALQQSRVDEITIVGATFTGTDYSVSFTRPGIVFGGLGFNILNYNGASGSHRSYTPGGTISLDTTIVNNTSTSMRMTPAASSSYLYMNSHLQRIPVSAGATCTVSVYIRKSVVGDGTAYNGADPTLILRYNPLAGNLSDIVAATASGSAGSWEQLTYTTSPANYNCVLEFFVICNGSTGWINIADWATTANNNTRAINYWSSQGPYVEISNVAGTTAPGGGSFTFVS